MRVAAIIAKTALFLAYPFLLYFGIRSGEVRAVGVGTAATAGLAILLASRSPDSEGTKALSAGPLAIVVLGAMSAVSRDARFVLAMPVLANGVLLAQFGTSLRGTPIVERFARLVDGDLTDEQVAYCRTVTLVWCGYFVLNGTIAGVLAAMSATTAWTLHTGILGYVGMGLLGGGEYLVRKYRFRKFDDHLVDRVLARLIPARGRS